MWQHSRFQPGSRRVAFLAAWIVLCCFCSAHADAQQAKIFQTHLAVETVAQLRELGESANHAPPGVISWRAVGVSLPAQFGETLFSLTPSEIRSSGYRAEFGEGGDAVADSAKGYYFGGTKANGDFLRLSLLRDSESASEQLTGFAKLGGQFYNVRTTPGTLYGLDVEEISAEELQRIRALCLEVRASAASASVGGGSSSSIRTAKDITGTALRVLELATDADFELYSQRGAQTNAFILGIANNVDGIYQSELGITIRVVFQHVHQSSSDPYFGSDPVQVLVQLQNWWNANLGARGDTVHLFTGRTLTPPTVGISYVGQVCKPQSSYGVSMTSLPQAQTVLTAHELGHELGADHDPEGTNAIMAPAVNNSTQFSAESKEAIAANIQANGACLSEDQPTSSNQPPQFDPVSPPSVSEGSTATFTVRATDPDGGSVSLEITPPVAGLSLSGTTATYRPDFNVSSGADVNVVATFTATDSQGAVTSLPVTITVRNTNRAPTISLPGNQTIPEGGLLRFTIQGRDDDGDSLRFSATGFPYAAFLNASTGSFRWTPRSFQAGSYPVTFIVSDPSGARAQATMTIRVNEALASTPPSSFGVPTVFRHAGGMWFRENSSPFQFGLPEDVALSGDIDGDDKLDSVVWRPSLGMFFFRFDDESVEQEQFGLLGDDPSLADYDGDGVADLIVFRQSTGQFYVRRSRVQDVLSITFGSAGDIPVVCDYNGDGSAEIAVFRPSNATWYVLERDGSTTVTQFGRPRDIPVPGAYLSAGRCNLAVWEPDNGDFNIRGSGPQGFGASSDIPAPADLNRDGRTELIVYRPAEGNWYLRNTDGSTSVVQLGLESDEPVYSAGLSFALRNAGQLNPGALFAPDSAALYDRVNKTLYLGSITGIRTRAIKADPGTTLFRADRDGDGVPEIGLFAAGLWSFVFSNGLTQSHRWGVSGDVASGGDFDGDNKADLSIFRPADGTWWILGTLDGSLRVLHWGASGDRVVRRVDYNGDGADDLALFRGGSWYILDGRGGTQYWTVGWGFGTDTPLAGDLDLDGKTDLVVYRGGTWFVRYSGGGTQTVAFGIPTDVPMLVDLFAEGRPAFVVFRPGANQLYARSLSGAQRLIQLPTRLGAARGRTRSAKAVKLQAVDLATPSPVS